MVRTAIACALLMTGVACLASPAIVEKGKPVEIWFVRHAESEVNVVTQHLSEPDDGVSYPLTAAGMAQANKLAASFKDVPVTAIYSSTRLRTVQTADAIAFGKGLPLRLAPEIVEIGVGAPTPPGTEAEWAQVKAVMARWAAGDQEVRFGNENLGDVRRRFSSFWERLIDGHREDRGVIVVVTHGGVMSFALPSLCRNMPAEVPLRHPISNAGVVKTEFSGDSLRCKNWNGLALD